MGQETSQVASTQDIYPTPVREPVQCAPRDGDQRVLVLRRGLRLPVHHQETEFLLVGQVQLRDECGAGRGDWVRYHLHVLCVCCKCFSVPPFFFVIVIS